MNDPPISQIPDDLRPYFELIATGLQSGTISVLVGAGFSKNTKRPSSVAPLPDWRELGDLLHTRLHGSVPGPEDRYLRVSTLAAEMQATFDRPELDQMLRDVIPDPKHEPSPLHVSLMELPWADVLTTNYDTLLERASSDSSREYHVVVRPRHLLHSRSPRIVKLHGSLPSGPFVITDDDYRRYPQDYAPFVNTVRQTLLEKTLCLIGFSGDDPNFLEWIGWLHDAFGLSASPTMYMIGLHSCLSRSRRRLLEQRKLTLIDLAECPSVNGDHYRGLAMFLEYMHSYLSTQTYQASTGIDDDVWPSPADADMAYKNVKDIAAVVAAWQTERRDYPGWVAVPENRRRVLWRNTTHWLTQLPEADVLSDPLDLHFVFELTWRTEKCLVPLSDSHAALVDAILSKNWDVVHSDGVPVPPRDDYDPQYVCRHLLLSLLRHYREEGILERWHETAAKLASSNLAHWPELEQRFSYEQVMFAMFTFNLGELRRCLHQWEDDDAQPFWTAKKAAIMAEIGDVEMATVQLEASLARIQAKSVDRDYRYLSQESLVIFLLDAARSRWPRSAGESHHVDDDRRLRRKRMEELRRRQCDPWHELKMFAQELKRPPVPRRDAVETPAFDIGRVRRTYRWGGWDHEALTGFNFLRFCEDTGIPFRMAGYSIAITSAVGTLARIEAHTPHWALATLVRAGDTKSVDEVLDRGVLASLDTEAVDSLIATYLRALRAAMPDITSGRRLRDRSIGTTFAEIIPEIVSRLCCKCSYPAKRDVVAFLLEVYQSEQRGQFEGIRHLTERCLESSSVHEQMAMVPILLRFPIPSGGLDFIERREFMNPLVFVSVSENVELDRVAIDDESLEESFGGARSEDMSTRQWAIATLGKLVELNLLNDSQLEKFGKVLWSQTGEDDLPSNTYYHRFAFLDLPHPRDIDPVKSFMDYVRGARFPAQQSGTTTTFGLAEQPVALCIDIQRSGKISWTTDDVRSIVHRLIEWWDIDKGHLKQLTALERREASGPLPSMANELREQIRQLVNTLARVVANHGDAIADQDIQGDLKRVVGEMSEDGIPTLAVRMACVGLFPEWRRSVLGEVEEQVASLQQDNVVDALTAIAVESERTDLQVGRGEVEGSDLTRLLEVLATAMRWSNREALATAMGTIASIMRKHPWMLADEIERSVLSRLDRLIDETSIPGASAAKRNGHDDAKDIANRLLLRKGAAALAYRMVRVYRERGVSIPEGVRKWEAVCRAEQEFGEIRRQWVLAPPWSAGTSEG